MSSVAVVGHADEHGPKDKRVALVCDPELPVIISHPWRLSAGWRFPTASCISFPLSPGCRFWATQQQHEDAAATTASLLSERLLGWNASFCSKRGNHAVTAEQRLIRTLEECTFSFLATWVLFQHCVLLHLFIQHELLQAVVFWLDSPVVACERTRLRADFGSGNL